MKNKYALCKMVYGADGESHWIDIGPSFDDPISMIIFVSFNHGDETGRLEISEFDQDGEIVESVSYDDFVIFYSAQVDGELAELTPMERAAQQMTYFAKMGTPAMNDLKDAVAEAMSQIAKSAQEAIEKIQQATDESILAIHQASYPDILKLKTGDEVVETDLRRSSDSSLDIDTPHWLEPLFGPEETELKPIDCIDMGALSDDK